MRTWCRISTRIGDDSPCDRRFSGVASIRCSKIYYGI